MKRSRITSLSDPVWKTLAGDPDGFKVSVVPAHAGLLPRAVIVPDNRDVVEAVCRNAFVDFEGYLDDSGAEIENSLGMRVEIFQLWGAARILVSEGIQEEQDRISEKNV